MFPDFLFSFPAELTFGHFKEHVFHIGAFMHVQVSYAEDTKSCSPT